MVPHKVRHRIETHPCHSSEKAMAPHSSTLAWKLPWVEEPGRLQSMGSLRVEYDWVTSLSFSLLCIGEGNGNPLRCSCLENLREEGAWWAAVYRVPQSRTWLKQLSSSSSISLLGEGNDNPLQRSCLENLRDGGAWWAAVYGVAQSPTWLKRLSSSSSSMSLLGISPKELKIALQTKTHT